MPQIHVKVRNATADNKIAAVYDRFGGARTEVDGSPFSLASGEESNPFSVNAGGGLRGTVDYQFVGGNLTANKEVQDGSVLDMD